MKKSTLVSGYIAGLSISIALVLKFSHLPGAGIMLFTTGVINAVFFSLLSVDLLRDHDGSPHPTHIAAALSVFVTELGITSRINHWPGADLMLIAGLSCFSVLFIPWRLVSFGGSGSRLKNAAGGIGLIGFAMGTLFKLEHWPGAVALLALFPLCIMLVYFPLYFGEAAPAAPNKLRNRLLVLITGSLIALYFVKSIEIHDQDPVPSNPWYQGPSLN